MPYANGKITAPVSFRDVQLALLNTSKDLGTLCRASNINMWAKYKPVISRVSGLIDTTPQLTAAKEWNQSVSSPWWRDTMYKDGLQWYNCTYGIKPIQAFGLANLYNRYVNGGNWDYFGPLGIVDTVRTPYRLIDFNQYNHNAPAPLGSFSAPSSLILSTQDPWSIDVAMMKNQDDDDPVTTRDYVTPIDILTDLWGNCYFGFALIEIVNNQPTPKIWVTGNRYYGIGDNGGRLAYGHTYYVMPFYCNHQLPQVSTLEELNPRPADIPQGTQFATVPNIDLPQLVIAGSGITEEDARFSVRGVLRNGVLRVTAIVDATNLTVSEGTIQFTGGKYPQVIIYVCQPGTIVGNSSPNPNDVITSRSFYSVSSPLDVSAGSQETVGGGQQSFTIGVDKCRIFVYAGNGSLYDNTLSPRCSGDAMVSDFEPEPTANL